MSRVVLTLCALALVASAGSAWAAGPHDGECMECHSTHYAKGEYIIGVKPESDVVNPARTRVQKDVLPIDALCLGCHNEEMGILPVNLHKTHPSGVKPRYAPVPSKFLRDGVLTCVGCHDPHPNNKNFKYLVVPTSGGRNMGVFCGQCHPAQSDAENLARVKKLKMTTDPVISPIIPFGSKKSGPPKKR
jgi:hypothetical protein